MTRTRRPAHRRSAGAGPGARIGTRPAGVAGRRSVNGTGVSNVLYGYATIAGWRTGSRYDDAQVLQGGARVRLLLAEEGGGTESPPRPRVRRQHGDSTLAPGRAAPARPGRGAGRAGSRLGRHRRRRRVREHHRRRRGRLDRVRHCRDDYRRPGRFRHGVGGGERRGGRGVAAGARRSRGRGPERHPGRAGGADPGRALGDQRRLPAARTAGAADRAHRRRGDGGGAARDHRRRNARGALRSAGPAVGRPAQRALGAFAGDGREPAVPRPRAAFPDGSAADAERPAGRRRSGGGGWPPPLRTAGRRYGRRCGTPRSVRSAGG